MKEKGLILSSLLIFSAVLLSLLLPLYQKWVRVLRGASEAAMTEDLRLTAASDSLMRSFIYQPPSSVQGKLICNTSGKTKAWVQNNAEFCAVYHTADPSELKKPLLKTSAGKTLPFLDYENKFESFNDCNSLQGTEEQFSNPGKPDSGFFSAKSCRLTAEFNNLEKHISLRTNLIMEQQLLQAENSEISVLGYLLAKNKIILNTGEVILLAVGEINISELLALKETTVTVISASGNVQIAKISGPVKIRAYARHKLILPANTKTAGRGFEDMNIGFIPAGFCPAETCH